MRLDKTPQGGNRMLTVVNLKSGYGKVNILNDVNIDIGRREIVSIIGINGVGKSTFMKTIIGILTAGGGSILYEKVQNKKEDITKWPAYRRARQGIGYVPQGHGIFPYLTVEENLKVGALVSQDKKEDNYDRVYGYFPLIAQRRTQKAGTLSGGERAMLSIGRILVNQPEIILLDEPSEGVQPNIVEQIGDIILQARDEMGITILMVEQHLGLIQHVSERCYVMGKGTIIDSLTRAQINDYDVVKRYLSV